MAAKVKKAYFCRECGYDTAKWMGKCPSCGAWNSFTEEVVASSSSVPALVASHALEPARPQKVQEIECGKTVRMDTGNGEVNRVLGGGVVPGSLILLGGEPGIGKSTLSLQLALTDNGMKTLYVSGEESAEQIRLRADRIGINNENCTVYTETLLEDIDLITVTDRYVGFFRYPDGGHFFYDSSVDVHFIAFSTDKLGFIDELKLFAPKPPSEREVAFS